MHGLPLDITLPRGSAAQSDADPQQLARWSAELPLGDSARAADALAERLEQLNDTELAPESRIASFDVLCETLLGIADTLRDSYKKRALPLSPRALEAADRERRLIDAAVTTLEIAVRQRADRAVTAPREDTFLVAALERALDYLGRRIVIGCLLYRPIERRVWRDVHALYRYAEANRMHRRALDDTQRRSVEHTYTRILLLVLANPNQLMPGEADDVYARLTQWADTASILKPEKDDIEGRFAVDLASADPPAYATSARAAALREPRTLEVSRLIETLEAQLNAITAAARRDDHGHVAMTLGERMERDMLLRLGRAWGWRTERRIERTRRTGGIQVTTGLSAVHHFLSGGRHFEPEREEMRLTVGDVPRRSQLDLVPKDDPSWDTGDGEQSFGHGMNPARVSSFDNHVHDVWSKVYATRSPLSASADPTASYRIQHWSLVDGTGAGLQLRCSDTCQVSVQVGEVVAYRAGSKSRWRIGTLRWLTAPPDEAITFGAKALSPSARAVAVRALEGAGRGGEYFRALLLPDSDPDAGECTLAVPPAIYDHGTLLALNLGDRLRYVRLTRLIDTTRAVTLFAFEMTECPREEKQRIDTLRGLV